MCKLEYVRCAFCGKNKKNLLMEVKNTHGFHWISDEKFNLVRCRNCGLVYINPRPNQDEIGKFYNIDYYTTGNRFKTFIEKHLTHYSNLGKKKLIAKYKQAGKLLDIGCGTGEFLSSFISGKWNLCGIEPNSKGFNLSCKKVKGKIINNKLSNCKFSNDYFDVITMWQVFEHIHDPNKELQEINRILKDDGILVMGVPNVKSLGFKMAREHWFHLDSPRHLYHYDSTTINKILSKNGFKVFKMAFPFLEYPLDLYHSLLNSLGKNKFIRAPLILPLLVLSFLLKPMGSLLKVSETMIVFCRKGI